MSANISATTSATITLPLPVGTVISYMGLQTNLNGLASLGWLLCDGHQLSSQSYPDLYAAIGTNYGGDGQPNFNLPLLAGFFLRGVDPKGLQDPDYAARISPMPGRGVVGPVVGSLQGFAVQNHQHNWNNNYATINYRGDDIAVQLCSPAHANQGTLPTTLNDGGGAETRPTNMYTYYLIFTGLSQTQQPASTTAQRKISAGNSAGKKKSGAAKEPKKKG